MLTIINHFSKVAHFVALPKLPSARETEDLLVEHVFCLHGLPADIVSDRGPLHSAASPPLIHHPGAAYLLITCLSLYVLHLGSPY